MDDELERLRAENEQLRDRLGERSGSGSRRWVSFFVWLLVVLGGLSTCGAVLATWVRATALDTDRFAGTVVPVIREDAVATAVATIAVDRLFEALDVSGAVEDAAVRISPDLDVITDTASGVLRSAATEAARRILVTDQFEWILDKAVRLAHAQAVKVLTGEGDVTVTSRGEVMLDVGSLLDSIRDDLVADGVTALEKVPIPPDAGRVRLFSSGQLGVIRHAVDVLNMLSWFLPFASVVFFASAVLIAPDRRRVVLGSGIAIVVAAVVVLATIEVAEAVLLERISDEVNRRAATVVWNHLFAGLRALDWALAGLGLLVAAGAVAAGPRSWAVNLRSRVGDVFAGLRGRHGTSGGNPGPVRAFVDANTWLFRGAGIAVAVVLLLLLPASVTSIVLVTVSFLLYVVLVEIVRRV